MIEEQIHRGRRMAQELDGEDWGGGPPRWERRRRDRWDEDRWDRETRGERRFLEAPIRQVERLAREILRQLGSGRPDPWRLVELILRLQIESVSELVRLGFGVLGGLGPRSRWDDDPFEEEVYRLERDIDEIEDEIEEEIEEEIWDWRGAPSTPTTIRSTVPIPVFVWSHKQTEIDLDLPAGSQYLDLEVEPVSLAGSLPITPVSAFEAEFVALVAGPVILRIEVPRELPDGNYLRRILIRTTGEPVGKVTVQVGILPPVIPIVKKPGKKR